MICRALVGKTGIRCKKSATQGDLCTVHHRQISQRLCYQKYHLKIVCEVPQCNNTVYATGDVEHCQTHTCGHCQGLATRQLAGETVCDTCRDRYPIVNAGELRITNVYSLHSGIEQQDIKIGYGYSEYTVDSETQVLDYILIELDSEYVYPAVVEGNIDIDYNSGSNSDIAGVPSDTDDVENRYISIYIKGEGYLHRLILGDQLSLGECLVYPAEDLDLDGTVRHENDVYSGGGGIRQRLYRKRSEVDSLNISRFYSTS